MAVFASGRGSTFAAITRVLATAKPPLATIVLCVSNNPNPGAFDIARQAGIETVRLSPRMFEDESTYATALAGLLKERGVELVVLAGYMRQLPASIVGAYRGRILNIHPALLPKFGGKGMYGMHVHEAVIAAGEVESGPTVHLVDEEYDTGPIVAQSRVPVLAGDTPQALADRVLAEEHILYPRVVLEMSARLAAQRTSNSTDGSSV